MMLRCIGETTIVFFYLVRHGSPEEFRKFCDYALGKEKVLMLHMQDTLEEQISLDGETIDDIADGLGGEFTSEIQRIELKGWTKKNIRELAQEAGLESIYRWVIDPSSAEIHGSWSSIKRSNLVVCSQVLHRFHHIPKFYEPPIFLIPLHVSTQIYLMCQKLAVEKVGCPPPDQEIREIPQITEAFKKVFEKFQR